MEGLPWNTFGIGRKQISTHDPVNFPSKTAPPYADGSMHYSSILISEGQSNSFVNPLSTISPVAMQCLASTDEITEMVQRTFSHSGHSDIHPVQSLTPNPVSCQIASETGVSLGNVLQESVSSGDNLYAIVDGVVYQIVHGTAGETVQPAVSFIAADAAAGSTCLISQPALNDNSSIMVGNSPETSGLTVAYGADGSLVLEQTALTSYQGHGAGGDSNQMHIVMTADSFGLPGNGLSQVIESSQPPGSQSYVLSSLASYGQTVGESGAQIQTKTNDVVGLSINSEVGLLAPSGETAALAVLSVASDVLPDGAPRVPQTVLADECSDDEEFVYLVADKDDSASLTDNSKTLPAFEQSSGFLDSYVKFVRGDVVETLSAVANSTVLERPPLPRYIPELSHQRPGPRETLITESGPFACENGSDVTRSHRGCATVDIVNCSKGRNLLPTSSSKSEQGLVGAVDNSLGLRTISVQKRRIDSGEENADDSSLVGLHQEASCKSANGEKKRNSNVESNYEALTFAVRGSGRSRPRGNRSRYGRGILVANAANTVSANTSQVGGNGCVATDESIIPFNPVDPHHYQKGDFVVERKDMFTGNSFPIWKIEPGRLLLKFEPYGQIGDSIVYKSASMYSSWCGAIRNSFKAIRVKITKDADAMDQDIVYLAEEHLPRPVDLSLDAEPLMDIFTAYIDNVMEKVVYISRTVPCLKDSHSRRSVELVDGLLEEAKKAVLAQVTWKDSFRAMAEELPYYILLEVSTSLPTSRCCQASIDGSEVAAKSVWLYGPCYDRQDLETVTNEITRAEAKETLMGRASFNQFVTYHALHHYKYHLYKKCIEEILYLRHSGLKSESELINCCLQNRVWIQHLFRDFKSLVEKCIVVNVVDVARSANSSPSLDAVYAQRSVSDSAFIPGDHAPEALVQLPSLYTTSSEVSSDGAALAQYAHLSSFELSR